jgi:hypothetical protein
MKRPSHCLFGGRRVLRDSLRSFRNGVLGQFAREDETNGGLDLAGRDRALLVICRQLGSFRGNTFEDIVDEGVEDGHGTVRDTGVRVNLLENFVNIGAVGLLAGLGSLLLLTRGRGGLLSGLFLLVGGGLSGRGLASGGAGGGLLLSVGFGRHFLIILGLKNFTERL